MIVSVLFLLWEIFFKLMFTCIIHVLVRSVWREVRPVFRVLQTVTFRDTIIFKSTKHSKDKNPPVLSKRKGSVQTGRYWKSIPLLVPPGGNLEIGNGIKPHESINQSWSLKVEILINELFTKVIPKLSLIPDSFQFVYFPLLLVVSFLNTYHVL